MQLPAVTKMKSSQDTSGLWLPSDNNDDIWTEQLCPHLPILPQVGYDVCVEVGVAVVQGQGEGEEEPAQGAQTASAVADQLLHKQVDGSHHLLGIHVR